MQLYDIHKISKFHPDRCCIIIWDGLSIPEVVGRYLGGGMRQFMRVFSVLLLVLVGAVFLLSPAQLLANIVPAVSCPAWVWIILAYYFVATLLPIDKIIGKVYPVFGVALVAMALGLLGALLFGGYRIPEMTTFANFQLNASSVPIVPTLFITIAYPTSTSNCPCTMPTNTPQRPIRRKKKANNREYAKSSNLWTNTTKSGETW